MITSKYVITTLNDMAHDIETSIARHIKTHNLINVPWNINNTTFTLTPHVGFIQVIYTNQDNNTNNNLIDNFNIYELISLLEQIENYAFPD